HGNVADPVLLGGTENDAPFFVDLPLANVMQSGQQFSAPIILGTENKPVNDLYGIAFTLKFDPEIIDPQSIELQYDPSWLGVKDVNLLTLDKTFADAGLVKAALVRTDQNNVSGYGQVAGFIGIIDNIAGKGAISIEIEDVKAIQKNEVLIPLNRPVEIVELSTGTDSEYSQPFEVFPNPAGDVVYFRHPANLQVDKVEIKDVNGRLMTQAEVQANQLNVSDLAAGVYFLRIKSGERYFIERIAKF
ncbi:MAG: T9SS type A sorting domain-containing protein, partial [Bacteroidota bacterium]